MRYTTKTEYGLNCLVYLTKKYNQIITIHELSENEAYSVTYIEKIMQTLRQKGIVKSHQGKKGGYSLAKHPDQISIQEIINALEGSTFDIFCEPIRRDDIVCTHSISCLVQPLWQDTKKFLDAYYSSISLESLVHQRQTSESFHSTMTHTKLVNFEKKVNHL